MRVAALSLAIAGSISFVLSTPVAAQNVPAYAESAPDALARNMKLLGSDPKNFEALIGAGRAALAMGDTQAAAGFFGRADEVWSTSPLPQAGMGAALAQDGDGAGALQFFRRATQRGATQSMIGADRGLAYDLLGQHAQAQADYRAALLGHDGDEARRRLALSLAITGNKTEALSILSPLMARGDAAGARVRAFVLALTGDIAGAQVAIDAAMPGSSSRMAYFFRKLPTLRSDQKAAACNLGIFPGSGGQLTASVASPGFAMQSAGVGNSSPEDRIGSIQEWLSQDVARPAVSTVQPAPPAPQMASVTLPPAITAKQPVQTDASVSISTTSKLWLQLASGSNAPALTDQFARMKTRNRDLFDGINGYLFEQPGKTRLLIGPFRNAEEANIFADDLASVHIDAFTWTSQPGQSIRKLSTE